jgi:hypothetical protein
MKATLMITCLLLLSVNISGQVVSENIHIDQFGYRPSGQKIAILSNPQVGYNSSESYTPGGSMQIVNNLTFSVVYSAAPSQWNNGNTHAQSGDKVWWFDFTSVTTPGEYYVFDPTNNLRSYIFEIGDGVYEDVLSQGIRAFYYQRCGVAKSVSNGGDWNDGVCHNHDGQDLDCRLVTDPTNASLSRDLSGGWHDAGDYNKYVNYTHDPMHDLLFAYEDNPSIWGDDFNLPESGNGVSDILDEIKVELDWLLKMQEPDGSALMKVAVTGYQASSPPSSDMSVRRYGPAQASSTRAIASIFAHAAIVYELEGMTAYSNMLLTKAELAWDWIIANPAYSNYDNAGFLSSNPEVSANAQDDFLACAAVYLFAATGNTIYRDYFDANYTSINPYSWGYWYLFQNSVQDAMLYYASLPNATPEVASNIQSSFVSSMHTGNSDMLTSFLNNTDAYRAQINDGSYVWGNNREKSHASIMFNNLIKYGLDDGGADDLFNYARAASGYMHFIHGVNPMNKAMLSNMYDYGGDNCINEIYHAWFNHGTVFDNALNSLYGPPPGIIPGGINPSYTPAASYSGPALVPPLNQPIQKSYKDWNTGYPENSWELTENAITYQAAYVNMISKYVGQPSVILPIKISHFNVLLLGDNQVEISWETATETNNDFFIVEKSIDGKRWDNLQKVKGAGTSVDPIYYSLFDKMPYSGHNYYRVKQVDFDGQFSYSSIRSVYLDAINESVIQAFPNPSQKEITFYAPGVNMDDVEIFNTLGQKMNGFSLIKESDLKYHLNMSGFSNGIYYLIAGQFVVQFVKKDE